MKNIKEPENKSVWTKPFYGGIEYEMPAAMAKMLLLEPDDVHRVWRETANRVKDQMKNTAFSISINCFLRTMLFENENCFGEFVNQLRNYGHFIGVSGYGEQLDYIHLNQTMLLIVFE